MRTLIEANLCDGVIYGDNVNLEYVYMPISSVRRPWATQLYEVS